MKIKALCAVLVPVVAVGAIGLWPRLGASHSEALTSAAIVGLAAAAAAQDSNAPATFAVAPTLPVESMELQPALAGAFIHAEFKGNGRERLRASLTNKGLAPLRLQIPVGQCFEAAECSVIAVRPAEIEIAPGRSAEVAVQTAATCSTNKVADTAFRPSYANFPKLQPLLNYVQDHLELSSTTIQTALLAVVENLPLSAVAKFTLLGNDLPSRFDTTAFRVETYDLIAALSALREIGVKDQHLAMTIDPQLKIEAMIEPLTRAAAMRYYGITTASEWEYWKTELLQGDTTTRHYALYGIARFYPEVALEMLPKWVREPKTNAVYRLSALQALADTQRAEALPILRQLLQELGPDTELGKAAAGAARYLDSHLSKMAVQRTTVAFRSSKSVGEF